VCRQKTYTGNATETLAFTDLAGNAGSTGILIDRIDTTVPTATIAYSTTGATNQPVAAFLTLSETGTVAMT
jgi:hypothetical protein